MTRDAPLILSAQGTGPNLLVAPHVLTEAFDAFAETEALEPERQAHLLAHLGCCTYCRTAVIYLLCVAQEADRRSDNEDGQAGQVLAEIARIHRYLEAVEDKRAREEAAWCERMGAYAETIAAIGRAAADEDPRFTALAAHVASCPDCRSCLENTLESLADESEDTGS
jgi:hypothetical protein